MHPHLPLTPHQTNRNIQNMCIFAEPSFRCQSTHPSAKTLEPLGGEVNNTDHLDAIQCSAGIPCLLEFMRMHLNTVCRGSTLPCSERTPCWQLPLQQDKVHLCTKKKLPRNGQRIVTKKLKVSPRAPNTPHPHPFKHLWDMLERVLSLEASP